MNMTRRTRKTYRPSLESLENRQLMAVNVSDVGGVMSIVGDDANNAVRVVIDTRLQKTTVYDQGRIIATRPYQIQAVDAQLGAGVDQFELCDAGYALPDQPNAPKLNWARVNMGVGNANGSGTREAVFVHNVRIGDLSIIGRSTKGVNATIGSADIVGTLRADFGAGNDSLSIQSGSYVRSLQADFRGGNDSLAVSGGNGANRGGRAYYNQVDYVMASMGDDIDTVSVAAKSNIMAGSVDGGAGDDNLNISGPKRAMAQFKSFKA